MAILLTPGRARIYAKVLRLFRGGFFFCFSRRGIINSLFDNVLRVKRNMRWNIVVEDYKWGTFFVFFEIFPLDVLTA